MVVSFRGPHSLHLNVARCNMTRSCHPVASPQRRVPATVFIHPCLAEKPAIIGQSDVETDMKAAQYLAHGNGVYFELHKAAVVSQERPRVLNPTPSWGARCAMRDARCNMMKSDHAFLRRGAEPMLRQKTSL
jgi:hypothetical protein